MAAVDDFSFGWNPRGDNAFANCCIFFFPAGSRVSVANMNLMCDPLSHGIRVEFLPSMIPVDPRRSDRPGCGTYDAPPKIRGCGVASCPECGFFILVDTGCSSQYSTAPLHTQARLPLLWCEFLLLLFSRFPNLA